MISFTGPSSSQRFSRSADRLGIYVSAACAVHCIVTPVLVSMSAVFAHFLPGEERTHRTLAVAVAVLGAVALVNGFRRHKRRRILAMMAAGLTLIFCGAFYGDSLPSHACEVAITLMGSGLMITAHRMNHTFCRQCGRCTAG